MKFDPQCCHRRSIRLKGYDYSQPGACFIAICTQNCACLFGKVADGEIRLNNAGRVIEKWGNELPRKFPTIATDVFITMLNHIHGIVVINPAPVGQTCVSAPNHSHVAKERSLQEE